MAVGDEMNKLQARRSNGRWTKNTLQNTFGLDTIICKNCGAIHPYNSRDPREIKPNKCRDCGFEFKAEGES